MYLLLKYTVWEWDTYIFYYLNRKNYLWRKSNRMTDIIRFSCGDSRSSPKWLPRGLSIILGKNYVGITHINTFFLFCFRSSCTFHSKCLRMTCKANLYYQWYWFHYVKYETFRFKNKMCIRAASYSTRVLIFWFILIIYNHKKTFNTEWTIVFKM